MQRTETCSQHRQREKIGQKEGVSPVCLSPVCRKAAEQGHAGAQFSMGYCYGKGIGVEKNEEEAIKWFRKAAAQGQREAQRILHGLGQ